ncbi:MAG: ATPase [Clostridia bacterium]|nr:ATPase [Clostridia bacterium]
MEILEIIDKLEEKIDKAMNIPIINRSLMDKEELLADIEDIRLQLPEELKQARWMKEERKKIISEAQQEAESIIKAAEEKTIQMVQEHEITKKAYERATSMIDSAKENAQETRKQTLEYCDEILYGMQQKFESLIETLKESRGNLK